MNAFWLLVIYWSHYVLTQTLEAAQHSALMSVYDALGSSHVDDEVKSFRIHFLFFLVFGQDAMTCQIAHDSLRRRIVLASD
jgi:hypothetical protein